MTKKSLKDLRLSVVADVMNKDPKFIDGNVTVANIISIMREKKVSSLIVNRRSDSHLDAWGIVTRKDIVHKVIDPGREPHEVNVFEIMTKPLIMVSPGLPLKYCARLLHQTGVRRAPVFDGKEIIGIISNTDIFNAIEV